MIIRIQVMLRAMLIVLLCVYARLCDIGLSVVIVAALVMKPSMKIILYVIY